MSCKCIFGSSDRMWVDPIKSNLLGREDGSRWDETRRRVGWNSKWVSHWSTDRSVVFLRGL